MKNLLLRTIVGFLALMLILALLLFLSAGSLRFWQAWLFLAVFALCTILITAYLVNYDQKLLASRVNAGPVAETQKRQQVISGLANLFFIAIFVVAGLDYRLHWSTVPPVLSVLANGMVALGFWIVFLVFRENSYTSAIIEVQQEQTVTTTGPYHFVRHPMYAGATLLMLFAPLALGSWVALPFVLPLLATIVARLLDEEQFLRANLSGYAAYQQQVRYRLVPGVW